MEKYLFIIVSFFLCQIYASAQTLKVSGKVIDEKGEAVIGATLFSSENSQIEIGRAHV